MREDTFERYLQVPGQQLGMELAPAGTSFPAREAVIAGTALSVVLFGTGFAKPENAEAAPKSGACTPEQVSTLGSIVEDTAYTTKANADGDKNNGQISYKVKLSTKNNGIVIGRTIFNEGKIIADLPDRSDAITAEVFTYKSPDKPYDYRGFLKQSDGSIIVKAGNYVDGTQRSFNTNKKCTKQNYAWAVAVAKNGNSVIKAALKQQPFYKIP